MDTSTTLTLPAVTAAMCLFYANITPVPPTAVGSRAMDCSSPLSTFTVIEENPIQTITPKFMIEEQKPKKEKTYEVSESELQSIKNLLYSMFDDLKEKHKTFFRNSNDYVIELYIENYNVLNMCEKNLTNIFNTLKEKE